MLPYLEVVVSVVAFAMWHSFDLITIAVEVGLEAQDLVNKL